LFVILIIICFIIAAFPRCRNRWRRHNQHILLDKSRAFATALRSQSGTVVLPAIPILTTVTPITLTQSACNTSGGLLVPKTGNYSVFYSVQFVWSQEATVSVAVNASGDCKNAAGDLVGSQEQETIAIASSDVISHSFLAFLHKGATLQLTSVASIADSISVPASDSATLQTPTTLASLTITEI